MEQEKIVQSCSKKTISIIKRNKLKSNDDFYCLSCLQSFRTKSLLKKASEIKNFCNVVMFSEDTKILEFHQY